VRALLNKSGFTSHEPSKQERKDAKTGISPFGSQKSSAFASSPNLWWPIGRPSSMSVRTEEMAASFAVTMGRARQRNSDLPAATFRWSAGNFYVYLVGRCMRWGHYARCLRFLKEAVRADPVLLLIAEHPQQRYVASHVRVPSVRQRDHQRVYDADFEHDAIADFLEAYPDYLFSLTWWRNQIAVVSQDVYLFNASVAENILYGKLDATGEELLEAARKAHALEFIEDLPDGLRIVLLSRSCLPNGGMFAEAIPARKSRSSSGTQPTGPLALSIR
jgi:hypothetical protein